MKAKEFFKSLIGLDISEAAKNLGCWWRLADQSVNGNCNSYNFERAAGGKIELLTDCNNLVTSERHNYMAEVYQKNDL